MYEWVEEQVEVYAEKKDEGRIKLFYTVIGWNSLRV